MAELDLWLRGLAVVVVVLPVALLIVIAFPALLGGQLTERATTQVVQLANGLGVLTVAAVAVIMVAAGLSDYTLTLGEWVTVPHYHFSIKFIFDGLSLPMVLLTFVLCGTIGAFTGQYLHREPGFGRFHVLYAIFVVGMVVASLAGTIETLFAGWELVGLSSALLVAFFHERPAPVRNGLWVWVIYRISDAALLLAAIVLHHTTSEGDFGRLLSLQSWAEGPVVLPDYQVLLIGGLLLLAAAGKSALIPFSGWLPRAMEGPTPSSAIFYGSLSVHLGAYLLLRLGPVLDDSLVLSLIVAALGLATALYAVLVGSVQTDIKSALAFAALTQVGLIVAEIGFGLRWIPLIHLIGHASLRTLQFLRASSLLQDYRVLENAIGGQLPSGTGWFSRQLPGSVRRWVYRAALERGYLDALLMDFVATPFLRLFRGCDRLERAWTDFLSGTPSRESDVVDMHPEEPGETV